MTTVIIPTSVFSEAEQPSFDQQQCIQPIVNAGGGGMEIREELFQSAPNLNALKEACHIRDLIVVYSSPAMLWDEDGEFNTANLKALLKSAEEAGAAYLKVSLGHYDDSSHGLDALERVLMNRPLEQQRVQLLVENDQTLHGGRIEPLRHFFNRVKKQELPVKMTFDTGNWLWTEEDGKKAFDQLKEFVGYLHLKGVKRQNKLYYACPLDQQSLVPWETYLNYFHSSIPCAIEFQVSDQKQLTEYVKLVKETAWEAIS